MIKIENVDIYGWEAAIRGMRNPKNSWDKSDTVFALHGNHEKERFEISAEIGPNDLKLMKTLANAGNDHGKFLRYLIVQLDIDAPLYWWKEFKTYRKGRKFIDDGDEFLDPDEYEMFIETNSCSTMHKIHTKEFSMNDFSHEHLDDSSKCMLRGVVGMLEANRREFLETKDKQLWWNMIQLLPSSYNQKRTVQLNYAVLKNMYHARKNHKLDEWRTFCDWIRSLPYSEIITRETDCE